MQDFVHQQYHREYEVVLEVWHKQHSFKLVISEAVLVRFIPIPIISLVVHLWSCFQCLFLAEKTLPESLVFLSLQKVGQLIYYLKHTAKASSKCLLRAVGHRNTYLPQVQNFRIVREKKQHTCHMTCRRNVTKLTPQKTNSWNQIYH